jgi:hypothetical protein
MLVFFSHPTAKKNYSKGIWNYWYDGVTVYAGFQVTSKVAVRFLYNVNHT